jgi:hypothetical protein
MLPAVGLLFGAAPSAQQGASPQRHAPPSASFRAGVDVVSLNVTVTDRANRFLLDLNLPEFSVFEDGIKQDVTFFARERQSIALSLLLDSSASMEDHLPVLHAAATNFVRRLGLSDVAQIVDFDSRVHVRQSFTGNQAALETAIRQTMANGSTALYSAVYVALSELGKVRTASAIDVRRQALIVFSDGDDTSSLVAFEDGVAAGHQSARKAGVLCPTEALARRGDGDACTNHGARSGTDAGRLRPCDDHAAALAGSSAGLHRSWRGNVAGGMAGVRSVGVT